ncbi:LysR family transcriptional regulator [Actinoallomurus rhizosphaericola]|uniref:LysR family transcriptional regulator n=1 Tax=Actinoallomurus rhizosphaericola TaxID=2952536 RepID=UPI0020916C2B|nr:LysR family transcriptional regulator [Actinoallomurus rhizosphaericola]MCO5993400.1 LysR substrate-binding domain-containing protein [Actinoallomurus rhizosphaericola]
MNDLESRELRYFVAVAEELHFGRAAQRLGMAQPPLSRAIRELERRLGVRLLERTTRQVRLTAAGEVLLRDARTALDAIGAAGRRARNAGRSAPVLRLALKADNDAGLLPRILSVYERDSAAIDVELVLGGRGEQAPALRDGRADVALLVSPFDDRGLDVEPLLTEPRLVALAASDPLAARPSLRLADLAGRSLPDGTLAGEGGSPRSRVHTGESASARPRTAPRELTAGTRQPLSDITQIFRLVELGRMVCFLPAWVTRRYPLPGIAYRPVADLEPATLAVAWPQDANSPAVAAFVRAATSVMHPVG